MLVQYYYRMHLNIYSITARRPLNSLHGTPLPSQHPMQDHASHLGAASKPPSLPGFLRLRAAGQEIQHPWRWTLPLPVCLHPDIGHHASSPLHASCLCPVVSEGRSPSRYVFLGLTLK